MKTGVLLDIHSYENRLRQCVSRIENDGFAQEDKLFIKNYLKHVEAQGVSKGRVFKIVWTLLTLRGHLPCNFRQADRGVIEGLVARLNGQTSTQTPRATTRRS